MTKTIRSLIFVLVMMSFVLSACGGAATTQAPAVEPTTAPVEPAATTAAEPTAAPTEDPLAMYAPDAVSGDIVTAGSSTVFPLSERMKQLFEEEGFSGNLTIDSIGTGAGFERFCKTGETDISNASRLIKDTEAENCKAIDREPVGFQVGIDAISVVVSKDNDFVKDVTLEELSKIFTTAEKWSDVRPEWPAEPIQRFTPGTDSGTFDYFVEAVTAPFYKDANGKADTKAGKQAILDSKGTQFSEDDNVLVQGVEGSKYAIGYFGFAYYEAQADKLNTVAIEGVSPDETTAEDGTYKLARPLFIYSDIKIMQEKPQVAAFIYFYLTHVNDEIQSVGYFPASEAIIQKSLNDWQAAVTG
jgi:phosphate transport system substrate-binding protein